MVLEIFTFLLTNILVAGPSGIDCPGGGQTQLDSSKGAPAGCSVVEQPATIIRSAPLTYPDSAKRAGLEGKTFLVLHIDTLGVVTSVYVKQSSGYSILDTAAIETAKATLFKPALDHGQVVASDQGFSFKFKKDTPQTK